MTHVEFCNYLENNLNLLFAKDQTKFIIITLHATVIFFQDQGRIYVANEYTFARNMPTDKLLPYNHLGVLTTLPTVGVKFILNMPLRFMYKYIRVGENDSINQAIGQ